jgi:hypothetical protein
MERIDHWIVLMFENRSFDNLLVLATRIRGLAAGRRRLTTIGQCPTLLRPRSRRPGGRPAGVVLVIMLMFSLSGAM